MKGLIRNIRHVSMLAVICLTLSSASIADTIFSTVTKPPNYCGATAQGCLMSSGNWLGAGQLLGQRFTYPQDFTITYIAVSAFSQSAWVGNTVTFEIFPAPESTGLPSTPVGTLTGTAGTNRNPASMITLTPTSAINLLGGKEYWLIATASTCVDPGNYLCSNKSDWLFAWRGSATEPIALNPGTGWTLDTNYNPYYQYAVDIEGNARVPEPTSILLLGAGLIAIAGGLRRRPR